MVGKQAGMVLTESGTSALVVGKSRAGFGPLQGGRRPWCEVEMMPDRGRGIYHLT